MTLQISLSAEILQAEVRVNELQFEYERLGQENSELVWKIARESSLERLQHRVAGLGYAPIAEREYVPVVVQSAAGSAAAVASSIESASPKRNLPELDFMEQLRGYFGGAARDALPNGENALGVPASVRFVGPEAAPESGGLGTAGISAATSSATSSLTPSVTPSEWWSQVWSDALERGEKSLDWITGGE
jgi:hypothetical protein